MSDHLQNQHGQAGQYSPAEGNSAVPASLSPQQMPSFPSAAESSAPASALRLEGLTKQFGAQTALDHVSLQVPAGSFYGLVGPNGAGKTTMMSMVSGLMPITEGRALIHGHDISTEPKQAKALMGVMPDGLRLFDRLTGEELLHYSGLLRGLPKETVAQRTADLLDLMDLTQAKGKLVTDYSAGMTKKITLAMAMIHAPRLLILDEPFEAVDPISAANIREVLTAFVRDGGTVIVSSHVMDLVQRMCDHVAVIAGGRLLAAGTVDEVRGEQTLEDRFISLVGGRREGGSLAWLDRS